MTIFEQLDLLFEQNHGIVKTAQVLEHGIAMHSLYAYQTSLMRISFISRSPSRKSASDIIHSLFCGYKSQNLLIYLPLCGIL